MRNPASEPGTPAAPDYGAAYHQRATHLPRVQTSSKRLSDHDCNATTTVRQRLRRDALDRPAGAADIYTGGGVSGTEHSCRTRTK